MRIMMKTVQMTLEEDLLDAVDRAVKRLGTTRSAFTRDSLRRNLARLREEHLERQHRAGYERRPVKAREFDSWESEQVWPD
jgi:metal-responsive CopG/Arc/MetJ family transcriptional regulator